MKVIGFNGFFIVGQDAGKVFVCRPGEDLLWREIEHIDKDADMPLVAVVCSDEYFASVIVECDSTPSLAECAFLQIKRDTDLRCRTFDAIVIVDTKEPDFGFRERIRKYPRHDIKATVELGMPKGWKKIILPGRIEVG